MSDIVETLRKGEDEGVDGWWFVMAEAANEIERLRAENETLRRDVKTAVMGDSAELQDVKRENEKLREALKPFAEKYTVKDDNLPNEHNALTLINVGDLRAARKALGETDD